jgi:hypothetical protein
VPRRRLSDKPKNLKVVEDITITLPSVIDLSEILSDVTGKVVCFLIEETLRKGQTGVVEFACINIFAEEITNDSVKNMFEIIHSSTNRNTVANNGKSTDIKYHKKPDSSILTSFSGAVHKASGQKEPLVLRKIIDGSTIMVPTVVDLSELRSYAHFLKNTMGEKVAEQIDAPEISHRRDVVIIPNGIECWLAVALALLACCWPLSCCWLLVAPAWRARTWDRVTVRWCLWPGLSLVLLSCLPTGQAAKPRPQKQLGYKPWIDGLPRRPGSAMATAGDGSVWVFGGIVGDIDDTDWKFSDDLYKLDPKERRWHAVTTSGPRPSARMLASMVAVRGRILVVFGGLQWAGSCSDLWTFDLIAATWTQLTAEASARPPGLFGTAVVAIGDSMLLFGGETGDLSLGEVSDQLWSLDVPTAAWTMVTSVVSGTSGPRPSGRSDHTMVAVNCTSVLLFGGRTVSGESDELWSLDLPSAVWRLLSASASGASRPGPLSKMVAVSESSVLFFDFQNSNYILWSLDVSSVTWTLIDGEASGASGPRRGGHAMALWRGHTGVGVDSSSVLLFGEFYSPNDELWSVDLIPGDRVWRWTLLNNVNVTKDEDLWEQFNNFQVRTSLPHSSYSKVEDADHCVSRNDSSNFIHASTERDCVFDNVTEYTQQCTH